MALGYFKGWDMTLIETLGRYAAVKSAASIPPANSRAIVPPSGPDRSPSMHPYSAGWANRMDDGSMPPGAWVHPSWFPQDLSRFGPPHLSPVINNIVRSKSTNQGRSFRDNIPASSQRRAPKLPTRSRPGQSQSHYRNPHTQSLPSLDSYISSDPPNLNWLFNK